MKLSKPEDMDELDEPLEPETTTEPGEVRTVEAFGEEMEIAAAVQVIAEMVEEPEHFGMATAGEVRELREKVAQQEKAIAELADAVESLSRGQAERTGTLVQLEPEPLRGIYDPTREF